MIRLRNLLIFLKIILNNLFWILNLNFKILDDFIELKYLFEILGFIIDDDHK